MRIYERHPTMDAYRVGGSFTPYAIIATDKRFSDAELAAEWWSACLGFEDQALTFRHFAKLPHYDEAETANINPKDKQ